MKLYELNFEVKKEIDASAHISNPIAFAKDPLDFNTRLLKRAHRPIYNKLDSLNEKIKFF